MSDDMQHDPERIPREICACFFTKVMRLNTEYRESEFERTKTAQTAIFHCLATMDSIGPDEDDVIPGRCVPGRECYVDEAIEP